MDSERATVNDQLRIPNTPVPQLHYDGRGDIRFAQELTEIWELHKERSSVYGTATDPLSNLHNSDPYQPHVGATIELGNIRTRVVNIMRRVEAGETIEDIDGVHPLVNALRDNASFSILDLILLREDGHLD